MWHFGFGGPDMERLVAGRERIYLDASGTTFPGNRNGLDEAKRETLAALYAHPAQCGQLARSSH